MTATDHVVAGRMSPASAWMSRAIYALAAAADLRRRQVEDSAR